MVREHRPKATESPEPAPAEPARKGHAVRCMPNSPEAAAAWAQDWLQDSAFADGIDGRAPELPEWWELPVLQAGFMVGWTRGNLDALKDELIGIADLLSPETWRGLWTLCSETIPALLDDEALRAELGRKLALAAGDKLGQTFAKAPYPQGHDIGRACGYFAVQVALMAVGVGEVGAVLKGTKVPGWMRGALGPLQQRVQRIARKSRVVPTDLDGALAEVAAATRLPFDVTHGGVGPRDVVVRYEQSDGLVTRIELLVGKHADPADVAEHARTVAALNRYAGMLGRLRLLLRRLASKGRLPEPGQRGFEARLELEKLGRLAAMRAELLCDPSLDAAERAALQADLDDLDAQLLRWQDELPARDEGLGEVALRFEDAAPLSERAPELLEVLQKRSRSYRSFFDVARQVLDLDDAAIEAAALALLEAGTRAEPVQLRRALKRHFAPQLAEAIATKGPPNASVRVLREVLDGLDNQSKGRVAELWYRAAMGQRDAKEEVRVLKELAAEQGLDLDRSRRLDHVVVDEGQALDGDLRERLLDDGYDEATVEAIGRVQHGVVHEVKSGRRLRGRDFEQLDDLARIAKHQPDYLQEGVKMRSLVVTLLRPEAARHRRLVNWLKKAKNVTLEVFDVDGTLLKFKAGEDGADALRQWGNR